MLVHTGAKTLLFDAGRGVATRLAEAGVAPQDLDALFITHHHFDHIGGLADLLLSLWNSGRSRPMPVYGPAGTGAIIETLLGQVYRADIRFREREAAMTGVALCPIDALFPVVDVDAGPVASGEIMAVTCERVSHGHGLGISFDEFPCLGYRIALPGHVVAISGDTVECDGLDRLAAGADTLVLCCYLAASEQTDYERDIVSRHILLASDRAGVVAQRGGVTRLVLTHIRRKPNAVLKEMHADAARDFTGEVIVGEDLMTIPLTAK